MGLRGQQLAAFTQHNVGSNMKQEVITFVDEEGKEIKVSGDVIAGLPDPCISAAVPCHMYMTGGSLLSS